MLETVTVTQANIDEAEKLRHLQMDFRGCVSCPIGLALRPRHPDWTIRRDYIDTERGVSYKPVKRLPRVAIEFIKDFDSFRLVKPISFTIRVKAAK